MPKDELTRNPLLALVRLNPRDVIPSIYATPPTKNPDRTYLPGQTSNTKF